MKKIVAILLVFIAISCGNTLEKSNSLIDYIPRDSQIIIKINDLEKASSTLRDNNFIKNNTQIALVDYFKGLSVLNETKQKEGLLCFSPRGKNDFEYTFVSKFDPHIIQKDSSNTRNIETINYSERTIYKVSSKGKTFYATRQDSILIASSSQLLIENVIRVQANPLPIDNDLQKVYEVSGSDNTMSILLNGKKLKNIHNSLLPNTTLKGLDNFSGWASLDATLGQNSIRLDGIAVEKDSLSSTIGIFDNTIPQPNEISKITPITALGFISYTYDDFYVLKENLSKTQDRELEDVPNDLDELLSGVSEIGVLFMEKENALVLNSLDGTTALESLNGEKTGTYRNITLYKYQDPSSFSQILTPLVKNIEAKFYFVQDDFIVFASSTNTLKDIIANALNQTLIDQQEYYKNTVKGMSDNASILMVGTVENLKNYVSTNVEETYKKQWIDLRDKDYQIGVLQVIKENDFAHIHSVLQKNIAKGTATSVSQTASTTLENKILNRPILVKNHRTKGMDAVVQDIENNLYLISDKGSIYWKKQIDGEILGDIQQIDIYKNGRYQLLFNTSNTLYVLDRDGKDVASYPKKFENTITQPLSLFDYDKSKRYRIIITQGNQIKMFDAEGKIVTGFGFKETETDLILPPKHIRIGTKDYILLSETNGTLTILDRLGRSRVNVKDKVDFSKNEWYQYQDKFTSTTKDGKLIQVQADGNAVTQNLKLKNDHNIMATNKTLVTFSENRLAIKGRTLELNFGVYTAPKLYYINNKIYITITDIQAKKVYLYDSNAELFPNFPVYGNSVLSLGNMDNDDNLEFVVQGEENSILIYQIN
ncbi:ribonuclease HII [Aquimarina sp. AU474]|uniref:ribonuclease HII n=1 Tax=Aquimarina sp. AU474 TaxID=2108529 RepID=UPI001357438B|nr:ribonuclease HII [Aquimarina sp. AU474]